MAGTPLYQHIAEDLRNKIQAGALQRGAQIPTEYELQETYGASRNTIRDAIKRLISQGLIETRPGQGTFVTTRVDAFVTVLTADPGTGAAGREAAAYLSKVREGDRKLTATVPRVEVLTAPEVVAARLGIPQGSPVISRRQERSIDGIPWSLQTTFYPMDFMAAGATRLIMAQEIEEGEVAYLAEAIGRRQVAYRDWISGRLATSNEQTFFGVGHDAPVFAVSRIAFDQDNLPMRVTVTIFPADRNQFVINVGTGLPDPQYSEASDEY